MKKTYKTKPNKEGFFRIGKALIRIEFDENGYIKDWDSSKVKKFVENLD